MFSDLKSLICNSKFQGKLICSPWATQLWPGSKGVHSQRRQSLAAKTPRDQAREFWRDG